MPDGHFKADALSHFHIGLMLQNRGVGAGTGPEGPWLFQILADQLTLSQPRGTDYAHRITTFPLPGFSDLPTSLRRQSTAASCFVVQYYY
jgi:hypothetical protein